MNILHLLVKGGTGGIETLCKEYVTRSTHRHIVVCMWDGGDLANEMASMGVELIICDYKKMSLIKTKKFLIELCKKERIDVIITQHESPFLHMYMFMLKKMFPNIFTIAYAHSNAQDMCERKQKHGFLIRKFLLGFFFRQSDYIVAISCSVRNSVIDYFKVDNGNINVIYNGVDIKKYCIKQSRHLQSKPCELIYVGRLIEEKGVQNIIDAVYKLPSNVSWHFSIVGDGPYKEALMKKITKYNLADRIDLLGNRRDVDILLKKADIFIHLPNWEEGFGITIIEAMASGKICICNDRGAIPEIITKDTNGFIVPANNSNAINTCVEKTIKNIDSLEYDMIRNSARRRAHQFNIDIYVNKFDELINSMYCKEN